MTQEEREALPLQIDVITLKAQTYDELTAQIDRLERLQGNAQYINIQGGDENVQFTDATLLAKAETLIANTIQALVDERNSL